ncbi:Soluble pyridine nucleotide transhydrogenase [Pseudobythopirellula maris]|uniref:Soluble pyridine nucleotide transhydrogenase n=1 Tax=Pseudobythopirellula maris TaxID=2527991 RepID=A0A5C5ZSX8_9BACT|nr:Si-specific NAD(P)(+) transhydrogenase [Pseudobythopirellula maris]TWT90097.1 Soluble pyridine nucleotide transhydrogenase [Pseudobythopirellula maris]
MRYDLAVIGSGPGGQKAAIAAAKLGKRVAIVERRKELVGGVCLHTGTIPSKTMREAILHLTGFRQREVYGDQYRHRASITMDALRQKLEQVSRNEWEVIQDQFDRNGVDTYFGEASFLSPNKLELDDGEATQVVEADHVLIATGTRPARPDHIPFDGRNVFDSDEFLDLDRIPRSMVVVGGGVIGIEYGLMFATLGVRVTVIDGRDRLLDFCDREIVDSLVYHGRSLGVAFRLGEAVSEVRKVREGVVAVELESGKRILGETVLFSVGRQGDSDRLKLGAAGLDPDNRGRLKCSEAFQTEVPHIYAVGDVVGFPALASASMEQGRQAVCHMFGVPCPPSGEIPYGLFTVPEISLIGKTEQQLTADHAPYEMGIARFSEIARGHITGDKTGMLKLLFHRETLQLLGVHAIGEAATEIVHIGQAVMSFGGTIEYFRDAVFNYPTMAECYKVAALDGLNKLAAYNCESHDESGGETGGEQQVCVPPELGAVDLPTAEPVAVG